MASPAPKCGCSRDARLRDPTELAYYFAHAPRSSSLLTLAQVAGTRYTVEQVIKEAKGEVGLDRYEVRFWHSWYRHITLSMQDLRPAGRSAACRGRKKRAWRISPCPKRCGSWRWLCPCLNGVFESG